METYSTSSSSSSSSMYLSKYPQDVKNVRGSSHSYNSSLHSVRKPYQIKPWKKPIAPLPPTPPRVYKVDPINFRDLVQKLTGAVDMSESQEQEPEQQQRLQRVAPPPLDLDRQSALFGGNFAASPAAPFPLLPSPVKTPYSAFYQELMSDPLPDSKPKVSSSSLEFNLLSPSTHGWCSIPLLSPGTLSILEQSTVL